MPYRNALRVVVLTLLCAGPSTIAQAQIAVQKVVHTDDPVPDLPTDVEFAGFADFMLNDNSEVTYLAFLTGPGVIDTVDDEAIFSDASTLGAGRLFLRMNDPLNGSPFDSVRWSPQPGTTLPIGLNVDDRTGLQARLGIVENPGNPPKSVSAAVVGVRETLSWDDVVALEGDTIPGYDGQTTLRGISVLLLNDPNHVAFHALLDGPAVTPSNEDALFLGQRSGAGGLFWRIVRTADPAPGTTNPNTGNEEQFASFQWLDYPPLVNNHDQFIFAAELTGPSSGDRSLWQGQVNAGLTTLQLLAREGDSAPGVTGSRSFQFFRRYALNDQNHHAFAASFTPGIGISNTGVWSDASGSLSPIVLEGNAPPGINDGRTFADFVSTTDVHTLGGVRITMNTAGDVAFRQVLRGATPDNDVGIWVWREDQQRLRQIAVEAMNAPGMDPAHVILDLGDNNSNPLINAAGQVAFFAILDGPDVAGTLGHSLWATGLGGLQLVVRSGQLVTVAPGDQRTVQAILLTQNGGTGEDGLPLLFNDNGDLLYRLFFTDGSFGLFMSHIPVPEPATATLLLAGLTSLIRRPPTPRALHI